MKRRHFVSTSALASYCFLINPLELISIVSEKSSIAKNRIQKLTISLLEKWCKGLYDLQTNTPGTLKMMEVFLVLAIMHILVAVLMQFILFS